MAETYVPKSPRPTRAQISAVFKDVDFARKVERIFDDLLKAAEASNANAAELDEIHARLDTTSSTVAAVMALVVRAREMSEANEHMQTQLLSLRAELTRLRRAVSDLQEAPL